MIEFGTKLVDWLKQPPRVVASIAMACAVVLFAPQSIKAPLLLDAFVENYGGYVGVVLVFSCCLLFISGLVRMVAWCKEKYRDWKVRTARIEALKKLTDCEKKILRYYIENHTKTNHLSITDGAVSGLEAQQIIARATTLSLDGPFFDFNIQPWAWQYINEHPELLE